MFQNLNNLYGRQLGAQDGEVGRVKDFLFHEQSWRICYVVVDTGPWLPGRQLLLPPLAFVNPNFGRTDDRNRILQLNLTKAQLFESPALGANQPVSQQYQKEYHRYFGWPTEWDNGEKQAVAALASEPKPGAAPASPPSDQPHLRSAKTVTGFQIQATDGSIGSVVNFMVHERTWSIRELVVETGHWYSGKTILLLPENILRISEPESTVFVNLKKEDIQLTMRNDVAQAGAGRP